LIACKTIIGFGAPNKAGSHKVHGSPLGADEIAAARKALNWPYAEPFEIPSDVLDAWRGCRHPFGKRVKAWEAVSPRRSARAEFSRRMAGDLPAGFDAAISDYKKKLAETKPKVATRKASEDALEVINGFVPETLGGSADLTPSNNTKTSQMIRSRRRFRRPLHALRHPRARHGGGDERHHAAWRPDPLRRRLPDLLGLLPSADPPCFADGHPRHPRLTHDSIGSAKTARPISRSSRWPALRAIPNLMMFRPADATETAECWQIAIEDKNRPSGLALTRQNLAPARTDLFSREEPLRTGRLRRWPATPTPR
jgi:transketolase